MQLAGQVIEGLLWFFIAFMWVRFVTEWVQVFARSWSPRGVLLVALEVVYSVTDPPIKALRRFIPPLRIGNFALDLSMLLVFIGAYVLLARQPRDLLLRDDRDDRVAGDHRQPRRYGFHRQTKRYHEHEWVRSCR